MNSDKKQKIFNLISLSIIIFFGLFYLSRLIYFKILNDKKIVYSDLLAEQVKQRTYKYEAVPTLTIEDDVYRFVNEAKNNYVKFMGYIWRIVKVNDDNTITMITENNIISLAYNSDNFENSQIKNWLNVSDKYTGIFYNTLDTSYITATKTCLDSFDSINNISCQKTNNFDIALLSVEDYTKAGATNSYLNNGEYFWTTNNYQNEYWYISNEGKLGLANNNMVYGIRPVITLNSDTKVINGNGTIDNPYEIIEHKPQTLKDIYVGEYLTLNDTLWRVVAKNNNNIKLVSEDYVKGENGILETYYSDYNNEADIDYENGLLYYLNNTYYDNFKEKDLITKGTFYTGGIDNDYQTIYESNIEAYVGLLSIAEPFVYDFGNVFTLSKNINNDLGIFVIDENKMLFEDTVDSLHYVRPAIHIKNDVNIKSGEGTYLSPYILGDDNNEES